MLVAALYKFRYAIALALIGLLLYALYQYVDGRGYDRHKRETAELVQQARDEAAKQTSELQAKADKNLKEKEDALKVVTSKLNATASELRQRPPRRTGADLPQAGTACEGGTGAGLSGPDAGFLAREAARANTLRASLAQCYTQYADMEEKLKAIVSSTK